MTAMTARTWLAAALLCHVAAEQVQAGIGETLEGVQQGQS